MVGSGLSDFLNNELKKSTDNELSDTEIHLFNLIDEHFTNVLGKMIEHKNARMVPVVVEAIQDELKVEIKKQIEGRSFYASYLGDAKNKKCAHHKHCGKLYDLELCHMAFRDCYKIKAEEDKAVTDRFKPEENMPIVIGNVIDKEGVPCINLCGITMQLSYAIMVAKLTEDAAISSLKFHYTFITNHKKIFKNLQQILPKLEKKFEIYLNQGNEILKKEVPKIDATTCDCVCEHTFPNCPARLLDVVINDNTVMGCKVL